jgi:hypothetical protein
VSRLRLAGRFFALGAILAAVAMGWPADGLTVRVPAGATPAEIDEAILLEHAVTEGWAVADGVVRQRLLARLAAAGGGAEGLDRAFALGLHRKDPVARARLVESARRALSEEVPLSATELAPVRLRALARASLLGRPEMWRLRQVWFGGGANALALGGWSSRPRLARLLGEPFAAQVARAPDRVWWPVDSPFGLALVLVEERKPAGPCAPDKLAALMAEERRTEARRRGLEAALAEKRRSARFVVEERP